jgi:acyl carrier protein
MTACPGRRSAMNVEDRERLRTVVADAVGLDDPADLSPDTDFFADLNIERDDLADIIVAVEVAFDISLDDGLGEIRTFEDLEALVDDLIPA